MSKKLSFSLMLAVTILYVIIIITLLLIRNMPQADTPRTEQYKASIDTTTEFVSATTVEFQASSVPETTEETYVNSGAVSTLNNGRININTATAEDLILLPGIGKVLANRIIEYREANGPFKTVAEIDNVSGIGQGKLNAIVDYITVGG